MTPGGATNARKAGEMAKRARKVKSEVAEREGGNVNAPPSGYTECGMRVMSEIQALEVDGQEVDWEEANATDRAGRVVFRNAEDEAFCLMEVGGHRYLLIVSEVVAAAMNARNVG